MNISKKLMLCALACLSLSQIIQSSQISNTMYRPISYSQTGYRTEPPIKEDGLTKGRATTMPAKEHKTIRKIFTLSAAGNGDTVSVSVAPFNEPIDDNDENAYEGTEQVKKIKTAHADVVKKPTVSFSVPSQFTDEVDGKMKFFQTNGVCIQINNAENKLLHFHVDFESIEKNETFYITSTNDEEIPMLISNNGKPNVNAIAPEALYDAHSDLSDALLQNDSLSSLIDSSHANFDSLLATHNDATKSYRSYLDTYRSHLDTRNSQLDKCNSQLDKCDSQFNSIVKLLDSKRTTNKDLTSSVESSPLAHLKDKENSFDSVATLG